MVRKPVPNYYRDMKTPDTYLLGKREAAKYLGVSLGSIERLMRGGLPYVKVGNGHFGAVRFAPEDLAEFIAQRRVQRSGDAA